MKKLSSLLLLSTKATWLVLIASMSFWGTHTMAMPVHNCDGTNDKGCSICTLALENLSNPFVERVFKKEIIKESPAILPPVKNIFSPKISWDFKQQKTFKDYPECNYLYAKKKIVLVI